MYDKTKINRLCGGGDADNFSGGGGLSFLLAPLIAALAGVLIIDHVDGFRRIHTTVLYY